MAFQKGWRWCHKCSGLFFTGSASVCPRGGGHDGSRSVVYAAYLSPTSGGQDGWRWCKRCSSLFFSGVNAGRCPAGGGHDASGSGQYAVTTQIDNGLKQAGWRWCCNCQSLFHGGTAGACPAGGAHNSAGSSDYTLLYSLAGTGAAITYQGAGNSGHIYLLLRQNGSFEQQLRVPGGCSETPFPVMHSGKLWIFYQGQGNSRDLWFTTYDGYEFSDTQQVPGVRLTGAPAVTSVGGVLRIYVQGTSRERTLWRITQNGDKWISGTYGGGHKPVACWNDPGAIAVKHTGGTWASWCVFERAQLKSGTGDVYESSGRLHATPNWWNGHDLSAVSSGSPAATFYKDRVYVVHEGPGANGELWYQPLTTGRFNPQGDDIGGTSERKLPVKGTSGRPGPVVEGNTLHVFHEGLGDNGELWFISSTDGENWGSDQRVANVGCSSGCSGNTFQFDP